MGGSDSEDTLRASVAVVLRTVCRFAALTTLELAIAGSPESGTMVRGAPERSVRQLALWVTSVEAGRWHSGFLLVATAPEADPARVAAVRDAAALVDELLVADQRRIRAERVATRATELAGLDSLTRLGNRRTWRRALNEEAARAARYGSCSAVVVVDLDGLKRINDDEGHAAGDQHLLRASEAVRAASRGVDVVCRLGGDEFAVLAPETDLDGAERLAERLREELARAAVPASVGCAVAAHGDLDAAWQEADAQMYEQKRGRRAAEQLVEQREHQ